MSRSTPSSPTYGLSNNAWHGRKGSLLAAAAIFAAVVLAAASVAARPLASIEARGVIRVCAHPNALPFASRESKPPGFQIEIARALARELGVSLDVAWVISPTQYRAAECDIVMDAIVNEEAQADRRIRVSKPYYRSGVALALRSKTEGVRSFNDVADKRIGVMVGSVAQMVLEQRGIRTSPFGFEDEMMEALSQGIIDGAAVSAATVGYFNKTHPGRAMMLIHAYELEPSLSWDVAVGMRGSDDELIRRVDIAIGALLSAGTIRDIYAQYGIDYRPPSHAR
jgi:polar amino acid transport system substrate-binding protein